MNIKNQMPKTGKKGALTGLVISFCAIIALVGVYTFNQFQANVEDNLNQVAEGEEKAEFDDSSEEAEQANTDDILNSEITEDMISETPEIDTIQETPEEIVEEVTESSGTTISTAVEFQVTDTLIWPVAGEVIMEYSMDESIYFETLDQYKRNPAMIISSEVGNVVTAAGRGIVQYVEETAETGLTVTIDMGNGFQAIYGQLENVSVAEGELVEAGGTIGTIAEPSIYYSVEGANLYFEFLQEGESIDPADYLNYE